MWWISSISILLKSYWNQRGKRRTDDKAESHFNSPKVLLEQAGNPALSPYNRIRKSGIFKLFFGGRIEKPEAVPFSGDFSEYSGN